MKERDYYYVDTNSGRLHGGPFTDLSTAIEIMREKWLYASLDEQEKWGGLSIRHAERGKLPVGCAEAFLPPDAHDARCWAMKIEKHMARLAQLKRIGAIP